MDTLLFMQAELTMGAEYNIDQLNDKILGYNWETEQTLNTESFFLQNEWRNKKISLLLGCRFDKNNLLKDPILSPRLNLRYNPSQMIGFRASYSSGFRASQIYDEDLHGTEIGGETIFINNDPDLKSEKSQSYSGSVDFDKIFGEVQTELLIEGFCTNLNNVFVLEEAGEDENGDRILERRNGSGAVVKGVNIEGKIIPSKKIQFQFGMTFQTSRYKEEQPWSDDPNLAAQKKMFRSPDHYGYLTANYQFLPQTNLAISGTYTGSMLVQNFAGAIPADTEKKSNDFFDLNFKLSHEFKLNSSTRLQLNGVIQNLFDSYQKDFDKGKFRNAGYIYGPVLPCSFFVGLGMNI